MRTQIPHLVARLDRLIRLCKEASYEYNLAANHVEDPAARKTLETAVAEHAAIARELEECVAAHDRAGQVGLIPAVPAEGFWTQLGRAAAAGDQAALLRACERGQRLLLGAFRNSAADGGLDASTQATLRRQAAVVARLHGRMCEWREEPVESAS